LSDHKVIFYGTGRRKTSVARVRLLPGDGALIVNGLEARQYLGLRSLHMIATQPLRLTDTSRRFNVMVKVAGGGKAGQAGAICHGIARALVKADDTLKEPLKRNGFLTRDPRMKERKKPGLHRARKAPQYSKR
jgi:small subunit ribosomal protein S9